MKNHILTAESFLQLLRDISKRPALYVGEDSLNALSHYLDGYDHAMLDHGVEPRPLFGWMRWIEMRFLIRDSAWGWPRILLHVYGSDAEAIAALPSLFEEFLRDRERMGAEGIEAECTRRLLAKFSMDWHAPIVTTTHNPLEGR